MDSNVNLNEGASKKLKILEDIGNQISLKVKSIQNALSHQNDQQCIDDVIQSFVSNTLEQLNGIREGKRRRSKNSSFSKENDGSEKENCSPSIFQVAKKMRTNSLNVATNSDTTVSQINDSSFDFGFRCDNTESVESSSDETNSSSDSEYQTCLESLYDSEDQDTSLVDSEEQHTSLHDSEDQDTSLDDSEDQCTSIVDSEDRDTSLVDSEEQDTSPDDLEISETLTEETAMDQNSDAESICKHSKKVMCYSSNNDRSNIDESISYSENSSQKHQNSNHNEKDSNGNELEIVMNQKSDNETPQQLMCSSNNEIIKTDGGISYSESNENDRIDAQVPDLLVVETSNQNHRKNEKLHTRRVWDDDELEVESKHAQKAEEQRIERMNHRLNELSELERIHANDDLVLDFNSKENKKICVDRNITKHLKPHQIDGIKHMYNCVYGNINDLIDGKEIRSPGCILAHCMGLGKTLQLIALLHSVIRYREYDTNRILIICPKSTILNWRDEIKKWTGEIKNSRSFSIFSFPDTSSISVKMKLLRKWSECDAHSDVATCFLMNYEAYRSLVFYGEPSEKAKREGNTEPTKSALKIRDEIHRVLLKAADVVVCDEGHAIKNLDSITARAVYQIHTKRRIILTGSPVQNNLLEYYAMISFVKPSFLGTQAEFSNRFANPIKHGQHKDSSLIDIKYMKQRSYALNRKLESFVHRREASILWPYLPKKFEYVLYIPLTEVQIKLYECYLKEIPLISQSRLFSDYHSLRKIWTHPKVLENATCKAKNKASSKDEDIIDDLMRGNWWRSYLTEIDLQTILPSYKFHLLFEILFESMKRNEKCLIFSSFVVVLDVVEHFITTKKYSWKHGVDYYRLDGKTSTSERHRMITEFNKQANTQAKVFLISSKAGGLGINLIGANRIILLDTSWNPSDDQQNIFRIYRLGQTKPCYIYRLVAYGTMEEKIYSRSVTKQAMSFRVVDNQQIDRHYNMNDLVELYTLTKPNMDERETPLSEDDVLNHLLNKLPQMIFKYHKHETLLDNKNEEDLTEEEKKEAWLLADKDITNSSKGDLKPAVLGIGLHEPAISKTEHSTEYAVEFHRPDAYFEPKYGVIDSKLSPEIKLNEGVSLDLSTQLKTLPDIDEIDSRIPNEMDFQGCQNAPSRKPENLRNGLVSKSMIPRRFSEPTSNFSDKFL